MSARGSAGNASQGTDESSAPVGTLATEAMELLIEATEQIPGHSWEQPCHLGDWTIRDLVAHATGSAAKIVTLVQNGKLWGPSEPSDWICADPTARLREISGRLQAVLPGADMDQSRVSPQGDVPLHRALTFPISDLALHSWDLHRCQGRSVELPAQLLTFCRELVASLPEDMLRRPGAFGPAQPAPENATETELLMAHLGRAM